MAKAQPKQLKKNDFLAVLTEEPMTREQLVDALESYEFIGSWLDYLIEHFTKIERLVVGEDADGNVTYARKGRKTSGPRNVYRVVGTQVQDEELSWKTNTVYSLESKEISGVLTEDDKADGWSMTEKAAVKKASSEVFATYKAQTAAIKALLEADEATEDSEAA